MRIIKDICIGSTYMTDNTLIVPYNKSKFLVYSSTCFLYPCYVSYIQNKYNICLFILITYLISINYWKDCRYSWRRNIDLVWSRITLVYFFYNGVYHIHYNNDKLIGTTLVPIFTICFYKSVQFKQNWYLFHMLFHLFTSYGMLIIVNNI